VLLSAPEVATSTVKFQSVASERRAVTAELASSSLALPAVFDLKLFFCCPEVTALACKVERECRLPGSVCKAGEALPTDLRRIAAEQCCQKSSA
jgi:hypothetical protein